MGFDVCRFIFPDVSWMTHELGKGEFQNTIIAASMVIT